MAAHCETTRSQVLGDIRSALKQFSNAECAARERRYQELTLSDTPRPVVDGTLIERFIDKHTAVNGTVQIVASLAQLPGTVKEFLDQYHLPCEMVMGNTDFLRSIDWPSDWAIERRSARKSDAVSVTDALCAIAETGTIVVANSPHVSSTHLYLPENHVVILDIGQLVRHLEDALQVTARSVSRHARGIHLITGPSKTADVEQTIQYGAHGPRRLHVIIVDTRTVN